MESNHLAPLLGLLLAAGCVGDTPSVGPSTDAAPPDTSMGGTDAAADNGVPGGCDAGTTACSGACVALDSDPHNCGRCSHDCGMGAKCTASICQPFLINSMATGAVALTTEANPDNPMTAATHVFWASNTGAFQDNVTGGNMIMLSKSGGPSDIAVFGPSVYWPTLNLGIGNLSISKGNVGTASMQTPEGSFSPGSQSAIIMDPTGATLFGSYTSGANYGVYKCLLNAMPCSSVTSFAGVASINLASDGTFVFIADQNSGTIEAIRFPGSSISAIVQSQATPNLLRVDGTHLYWSNSGTKTLWRSDLTGLNPKQIVSTTVAASGLAADAVNAYWTDSTAGTVNYAPVGGAGPTTVYVTQGASSSPMRLVRDSQFLYWIQSSSIYRVALP